MTLPLETDASAPRDESDLARRVLAIVPALNESASVGDVVAKLAGLPFVDVLVVDDGSEDHTAAVAREAGASVIRFPHNLGIGAALRAGFLAASRRAYPIAFQFDADGQHDVGSLDKLLAPLQADQADLVIGSRFLGDHYPVSTIRRATMRATAAVLRTATGLRLSDPTSGFRGFSARAIETFAQEYPIDYMDSAEAIVLAHSTGLRIVEVPVKMSMRAEGEPSTRFWRSGWHTGRAIFSMFVVHWDPRSVRNKG